MDREAPITLRPSARVERAQTTGARRYGTCLGGHRLALVCRMSLLRKKLTAIVVKASGLTVHQELRRLHFDENWSGLLDCLDVGAT
jgi:hypothetical protein